MTATGAPHFTAAWLARYRRRKWRPGGGRFLHTYEQARRFIDEMGLTMLFGARDVPLPKIYNCAVGGSDWWHWKDILQIEKHGYYGRVVRGRAALISMRLVPAYLSLYYDAGGREDYREEYEEGQLSSDAKRIADFLAKSRATPVSVVRQTLTFPGKAGTRRFHRALNELHLHFKTVTVGIVDVGWGIRVIDLFERWLPVRARRRAEALTPAAARLEIARALVATAGAVRPSELARIFRWRKAAAREALEALAEEGAARVDGSARKDPFFGIPG